MGPCPSSLLLLLLFLGLAIHTQNRVLPSASIRAKPGPVIRRGWPVTIVCQGPTGADAFRLVEKENASAYRDVKITSPHGPQQAEATFHIDAVSDVRARSYFCQYLKGSKWSEPSEILELKVTGAPRVVRSTLLVLTKPRSTAESSTGRAVLEGTGHTQTNSPDSESRSLLREHLSILVGICVASLLCLLLLVLCLVRRQHQKQRGPPSNKGEEPRPQERLSPTVDLTESPAEVATTVDTLPEENGDMHSPSPAAEDPQEVTYAQLDQRALTRRAARAEPPQPTEPTPESSMYAALPRH